MATTEHTPSTTADAQELYEKEVIITAYASGVYEDAREMIADTFGRLTDHDLHETRTKSERKMRIELDLSGEIDGWEKTIREKMYIYGKPEMELLAGELDDDDLPDFLTFVDEVKESEEHVTRIMEPVKEVIHGTFDRNPLEDLGYEKPYWCKSYKLLTREIDDLSVDAEAGDVIEQTVRINPGASSWVDERRVLVHQSERTRDNRYDGDKEVWSTQTKISIEASSENEIEKISSRLIPSIYGQIASVPGIDTVRISDCQQKVAKSGECYNI